MNLIDEFFQHPSTKGSAYQPNSGDSVIIPKNKPKERKSPRNYEHRATVRGAPPKRQPQESRHKSSRASALPSWQEEEEEEERVPKSRSSRQREHHESRDPPEHRPSSDVLHRVAARNDGNSSPHSEFRAASTASSHKRLSKSQRSRQPRHQSRDWSRDPSKCPNSDWTIHVYRKRPSSSDVSWDSRKGGENRRDSYYIHTEALDRLPEERAPLFERIFLDCLEETGKNQSRLIIKDEIAARSFGILLDFLYAKTKEEEVKVLSNVTRGQALYRIAEYFNAQPLKKCIAAFYAKTTKQFMGEHETPASVSSSKGDSRAGKTSESSFVSFALSETSSSWNPAGILLTTKPLARESFDNSEQDTVVGPSDASHKSHRSLLWPKPKAEAVILESPASVSSFKSFQSSLKLQRKTKKQKESLADDAPASQSANHKESLGPKALLKVLEQRKKMRIDTKTTDFEIVSCLIAMCLKENKEKLTRTMFYKLTSKGFIPYIDQEAAIEFLTIEEELGFWKDHNNFSSLQSRCIRSVLADWEGLRGKFPSDKAYWGSLRKMSPSILGILLMHASGTSRQDDDMSSITDFNT
jgi:hypothetical protein